MSQWKLVPLEPTREMVSAAISESCGWDVHLIERDVRDLWRVLLAAATRVETTCKVCNGKGWNHGAQPGPGPGYKSIKCTFCDYWGKP